LSIGSLLSLGPSFCAAAGSCEGIVLHVASIVSLAVCVFVTGRARERMRERISFEQRMIQSPGRTGVELDRPR
jgi:hypothetical protein